MGALKTLKCREGDLCIVVRPGPNRDRLVRVLAPATPLEWAYGGDWAVQALQTVVDIRNGRTLPAGTTLVCADDMLRPLRGGAGVDATLLWAGLPPGAEPVGL